MYLISVTALAAALYLGTPRHLQEAFAFLWEGLRGTVSVGDRAADPLLVARLGELILCMLCFN